MTDLQILKELGKQLNIKFKKIDIEDVSRLHSYSIDKKKNIILLDISKIKIDDLTLIGKLKNLKVLSLSNNQIKDISALENLKQIYDFDLSNNQITDISALENLKQIYDFDLSNNPLKFPPKEIVELGTNAINEYFEHAKQGTTVLQEAKIVIIGEAGAGKTTFAKKIQNANAEMPKPSDTTLGIEVYNWTYKSQNDFYTKLWDFGGQDIYHGTHQFFFSNKTLYVLLSDAREQKTDFNYWLNTIEQLSGTESPLIILFNKKQGHTWELEDEYGLKRRFQNIIQNIITIDLSQSQEIPSLQNKIKEQILNLPQIGYTLPTSWVNIRLELSKLTDKYISYEHFRNICKQNNIISPKIIEIISKLFTNIGVFTHFIEEETNLQDIIFLDSNWLTKTVYSLLNNEIVKNNKGKINRSEIDTILKTDEIYFEINKFIELLKKFSLIYKINGSQNYIVPVHLKPGQPYKEWKYTNDSDIYYFSYLFDNYMPRGIMTKLIVALNQYIYDIELVWKRGVNIANSISNPDTYAEIIEAYGRENRFNIQIYGKKQKDLLNIIIYHFDKILKPFTKLTHEKLVPCNCDTCKTSHKPHFYEYLMLIEQAEYKIDTIRCVKKPFLYANVNELLFGIDFTELRSLLLNEKFDEFKELISQKFTDISYQIHKEKVSEGFFHSNFHTILAENGLNPVSETSTSDGRIDLHITIGETKYLFELKINSTPEKAIEQIREKKYYKKFQKSFKKIILIGINFSTKKRNIDGLKTEIL